MNKIKASKEGFKNTVSSASESIDKAGRSFEEITSKKDEWISELRTFLKEKIKTWNSSCTKIQKCNENINECVLSVNADCDKISSNFHEISKIYKNLIENVDEKINTNSTAINEICKEADENHLDEFDFKMIQTAFDKIQQNNKKVSEVYKCQAELQVIYETDRSSDELIKVIQNQKVFY